MNTWIWLIVLLGFSQVAVADCLVSSANTRIVANAQCESAMASWMSVYPLPYAQNECYTKFSSGTHTGGYVQCTFCGAGRCYNACSGCFAFAAPAVDKPKNCCQPADNKTDPILTGLGFKTDSQTDLSPTSRGELGFTRYYSSYDSSSDGWLGADGKNPLFGDIGRQWRHTYSRSLILHGDDIATNLTDPDAAVSIAAVRPNGEAVLFTYVSATGIWTPDADIAYRLRDVFVDSVRSGWVLTLNDDSSERYDLSGKLQSITQRGGFTQTLSYASDGTLQSVADGSGRTLTFSHDPATRLLTAVTAPDGTQVGFKYTNGYLTAVTYPGSPPTTRTYVYGEGANGKPHQMTGIVDENNARYASWQYDPAGRAWLSVHGGVSDTTDRVELTYNGDITQNTAATVTGKQWIAADGSTSLQRTYGFDVNFGVIKLRTVDKPCDACSAGSIQSETYDSAHYPASTTDFNGNLTLFTYDDALGVETVRIEGTTNAGASPAQGARRTETDWKLAPLHVPTQRRVHGANGVEESRTNWAYNTRGQATARCQVDPQVDGAIAYVCGSSVSAPIGVRQSTYTYCDAVGAGCPLIGLLLSVDGPHTDLADVTSYAYYTSTDLSGCGVPGGACHNLGDLQSVTDALGHVTTYVSYDKNGRVTRIKDANGTYTDMTYHARGWLLARTVRANADGTPNSALDAVTTFSYDAAGNITQVTQPDGTYLHYVYDAAHRLTDVYDSATPANYRLGDHIHYTLDAAGNRVDEQTSDANGTLRRELSRTYDGLNRLVALLNSSKVAVQTFANPVDAAPGATNGYDGNGNAIYSFDGGANHVGTEQQFDPLNRLVKTLEDHAGSGSTRDTTTRYAYDARDNLRSVTDPDGLVTSYTYDGLNRLMDLDSPDTGHTGYGYDEAGNRTQQTDARGVTSTYRYDALNRLIGIDYPTAALNLTYAYDQPAAGCFNVGHLTAMTDGTGSTQYCYDRRGNVLKKTQTTNETRSCLPPEAGCAPRPGAPPDANPVLTESAGFAVSYKYTLADRVAAITYTSGAVVTYGRDGAGRINTLTYQAAKLVGSAPKITVLSNVSYYPFGPANVLTFGNGRTLTKTYDTDYAISSVVSSAADGLVIAAQVDALGNLIAASDTIGGAATQQYSYDALYRLTGVQDGNGNRLQGFSYGPTGDRLTKTDANQNTQIYAYEPGTHHLASIDGAERTYDANGNTLTGGLSYDERNRLAGWQLVNGQIDLAGNSAAYGYNARGERVSKQLTRYVDCAQVNCRTAAGVLNAWQSAAEAFVYDESGKLLGEYPGIHSSGDATDYIYLDGVPVAMARGGVVYYVETDQLGTPREVFRPGTAGGPDAMLWKWGYLSKHGAFGEDEPEAQTISLNLRFQGQFYDRETQLSYNYFRDYEASTGRYVQADPVGQNGDPNEYSYVDAKPLGSADPLGLILRGTGFTNPQWKRLRDAEQRIKDELKKSEDCCINSWRRDFKSRLEAAMARATFFYQPTLPAIKPGSITCGETPLGQHQSTIDKAAFDGSCYCLAAVIYHELLHEMGIRHDLKDVEDPRDEPNSMTIACKPHLCRKSGPK